jgi:hypothetical protein
MYRSGNDLYDAAGRLADARVAEHARYAASACRTRACRPRNSVRRFVRYDARSHGRLKPTAVARPAAADGAPERRPGPRPPRRKLALAPAWSSLRWPTSCSPSAPPCSRCPCRSRPSTPSAPFPAAPMLFGLPTPVHGLVRRTRPAPTETGGAAPTATAPPHRPEVAQGSVPQHPARLVDADPGNRRRLQPGPSTPLRLQLVLEGQRAAPRP